MQHGFSLGRRGFIRGTLAAGAAAPAARAASEMQAFRLAAVTMRSVPASPAKDLAATKPWVDRAKAAGARMVCFPELSVTGYLTAPGIREAAEPVPGPSTKELELISLVTPAVSIGALL